MIPRPKMTNWLNPARLMSVGIRAAISTVFGQFADRREAQAAVRPDDPDEATRFFRYDEAEPDEDGAFWVDYLADTGDGWNATYSMAKVLCDPALECGEAGPLRRGNVLIMGGDQVYPSASPKDYEERLIAPFRAAADRVSKKEADAGAFGDLFAIPGNHDWYDGLRAFLGLFCRFSPGLRDGKIIGGRKTRQTRSYFAIKLPGNWWLWGVDSQLEGYIDQPQVDYFAQISKKHMDAKSKLIICTGYPSWTNVDPADPNPRFGGFSYMERLINNYGRAGGATGRVRLSISGDIHHYARHIEDDRHYVTCGGGGAYTHPTSQLKTERFSWPWPKPGEGRERRHRERKFEIAVDPATGEESVYPSRVTSNLEALKVLGLALYNPAFTLLMAAICWLLLRMILLDSEASGGDFLSQARAEDGARLWEMLLFTPWVPVHFWLSVAAYAFIADIKGRVPKFAIGLVHALAQFLVTVIVGLSVYHWLDGAWFEVRLLVASLCAGFASASLMGLYFLVAFLGCRKHWNEVFAALRLTKYKSMVRMKIDKDGSLTLYPIKLHRAENRRGWRFWRTPGAVTSRTIGLIESPVRIA